MKIELTGVPNGFDLLPGGSLLFKLGLIGFLTLLLLIPSEWIRELISERQNRLEAVNQEIADKWSGSQQLQGPVLILPYRTLVPTTDANGNPSNAREVLTNIYILPEVLDMTAKVRAEVLHRGIFDAAVYTSKIQVKGTFSALELKKSGIDPTRIRWDKAKVDIGLSDLKGLKNNPVIQLGNTQYAVEPDFTDLKLFKNNLIILPDLSAEKDAALAFSFELDLSGSNHLSFLHLGKNTTVRVEGNWSTPSFTGRYLPETRAVSEKGFNASWSMPYYNRPFPQQWIAENTVLHRTAATETPGTSTYPTADDPSNPSDIDAAFGVAFKQPIDQYQKTTRTAKYASLIILLTFISLLFTELLIKRKVHLLQYVLIGAAMTIYYTLLLALSEHIGFTLAYIIASSATIGLIASFILALLKSKKTAWLFGGILSFLYTFVFVIIQLQDLALLVGSVGLFAIIGALMYLSQKISWEKAPD